MIFTPTCIIKIHLVLVFNHCLIRHCGLHILVQIFMDAQLDGGHIRVEENPLVYIIRWMLERNIHKIDVTYAIKWIIIEKLVKLDNIKCFCVLNYVNFNYFSIILQMLAISYLYVLIDYMNDLNGGLNILSFTNILRGIWHLISTNLIALFWHCWDVFFR
jgi:hypothetical protein